MGKGSFFFKKRNYKYLSALKLDEITRAALALSQCQFVSETETDKTSKHIMQTSLMKNLNRIFIAEKKFEEIEASKS